jgi:hypothetical protein
MKNATLAGIGLVMVLVARVSTTTGANAGETTQPGPASPPALSALGLATLSARDPFGDLHAFLDALDRSFKLTGKTKWAANATDEQTVAQLIAATDGICTRAVADAQKIGRLTTADDRQLSDGEHDAIVNWQLRHAKLLLVAARLRVAQGRLGDAAEFLAQDISLLRQTTRTGRHGLCYGPLLEMRCFIELSGLVGSGQCTDRDIKSIEASLRGIATPWSAQAIIESDTARFAASLDEFLTRNPTGDIVELFRRAGVNVAMEDLDDRQRLRADAEDYTVRELGWAKHGLAGAMQSAEPRPRLGYLQQVLWPYRTMRALRGIDDAYAAIIDTGLAVQEYRAQFGRCPDSLQTLVQSALRKTVPSDPFADGPAPLHYIKTANGCVIYSVGPPDENGHGQPAEAATQPGELAIKGPIAMTISGAD